VKRAGFILVFILTTVASAPSQVSASEKCGSEPQLHVFLHAVSRRLHFSPLIGANGMTNVVGLRVDIKNRSASTISALLNHEWYGGLWPDSDIQLEVRPRRRGSVWRRAPGFLLAERGNENNVMVGPGNRIRVVIRLNWPGTGSIEMEPLIKKSGEYLVRLRLSFTTNGKKRCVTTPTFGVRVRL
jgi:hypothetical protein